MANQPSNQDLKEISIRTYNALFNGNNLGFFKEDTFEITINGIIKKIGVDQIFAEIAKAQFQSLKPMIKFVLLRSEPSHVAEKILNGYFGKNDDVINGIPLPSAFGIGQQDKDAEDIAGELEIRPQSNAQNDYTNSWIFWKAFVPLDTEIKFVGSKNNYQEFEVTFECLPDLNQEQLFLYGGFGDINPSYADPNPPDVMWFQSHNRAFGPTRPVMALSIRKGTEHQIECYGIWWHSVSPAISKTVSGAHTSTVTTLTLSNTTGIKVGDLGQIDGAETVYVTAILSTTQIAVVRAAFYPETYAYVGGEGFEIIKKTIARITQDVRLSLSSGTPANVLVGNKRFAYDANRRGVLSHGGTNGTGVITPLWDGQPQNLGVSTDLTVTSAA